MPAGNAGCHLPAFVFLVPQSSWSMYGHLVSGQIPLYPTRLRRGEEESRLMCPTYMYNRDTYPDYLSGGGMLITKVSEMNQAQLFFTHGELLALDFFFLDDRPPCRACTPPPCPSRTSTSTTSSCRASRRRCAPSRGSMIQVKGEGGGGSWKEKKKTFTPSS